MGRAGAAGACLFQLRGIVERHGDDGGARDGHERVHAHAANDDASGPQPVLPARGLDLVRTLPQRIALGLGGFLLRQHIRVLVRVPRLSPRGPARGGRHYDAALPGLVQSSSRACPRYEDIKIIGSWSSVVRTRLQDRRVRVCGALPRKARPGVGPGGLREQPARAATRPRGGKMPC